MPELLQCGRGKQGSEGLSQLTPTRNRPSFTPRRSGGRDESASHTTVELCACARAMDYSRGTYTETLLQSGWRQLYNIPLTGHAQSWLSKSTFLPPLAWGLGILGFFSLRVGWLSGQPATLVRFCPREVFSP
jgi:hypothetical protein